MPNIDPAAKAWELDLSGRIGGAVLKRRKALNLTAQELADRTAQLGYPVTRVAITKIEGNKRAGKVDVAEVIVLAAALDVPPVMLLYPDQPDGVIEMLPDSEIDSSTAAEWFSGNEGFPFRAEGPWSPEAQLLMRSRERRQQTPSALAIIALRERIQGTLSPDEREKEEAKFASKMRQINAEIRALGGVLNDE